MSRIIGITMFCFTILVGTQGCFLKRPKPKVTTFKKYSEAGRVIVGTQTVAPFEEYIDLLQPKFSLSASDSLAEAIPQTQLVRTRELRELLLALELAFPNVTRNESSTTSSMGEITNTVTREASSPSAPAVAIPDAVGRGMEALAALDASGTQTDAMLRYRAATALYQEVALLSSYLKDAAVSQGTVPYIVRQLVKVQPNARRSPYDAHLVLGYFSGRYQPIPYFHDPGTPPSVKNPPPATICAGKPISVIPLFVTDSIEASLIQSDRANVRDIGLASSGSGTFVGFGAGARSREETGEESISREINSLLTIGRLADNVLSMRIGAAFVENTHHLVARTYNLTSLVLVPIDVLENAIPCPQVNVSIESEFRDARTGEALYRDSLQDIAAAIARQNGSDESFETELLMAAATNSFEDFKAKLPYRSFLYPEKNVQRMWLSYVNAATSSGVGSDSFDLPSRQLSFFKDGVHWDGKLEMARNAVLDDGKSAVFKIEGGYALKHGVIEAKLRFKTSEGQREIEFVPTTLEVGKEGRSAIVTFPSVHKVDPKTTEVTISLQYASSEQRWSRIPEILGWHRDVPIVTYKNETPKKPNPQFQLLPSSNLIRANSTGHGQLALTFRRDQKPGLKFTTVNFSLHGGHVVSSSPELSSSHGAYSVSTDTIYTLNLGGLVPGSTLQLEAWRLVPNEAGKAGETISLSVSPVELFVVGPQPTGQQKSNEKSTEEIKND